jgi:peptide deformylase
VILQVRLLGDPILRSKTRPIERFDEGLASFARDLIETMYDAEGVGLAAPQVGDERRIAVIDVGETRDTSEVIVLVNPTIVRRHGTMPSEEGCLSIPGIAETIERAEEVEVEYLDLNGNPQKIEGRDLLSRVLQHEIDHLEGILFIDHLGALKRKMVIREWQRLRDEAASEEPARER